MVIVFILLLLCCWCRCCSALELPLSDLNFVIVTDVHSWVGSHRRHGEVWDADYGHVLSFVERLRRETTNVFFLMNGDFMDGTGISTYPPTHLTPILERMSFDAMTVGNHELYKNSTVEHMIHSGFLDTLGDRYITSNVDRVLEIQRDDNNSNPSTTTTTTTTLTTRPLGGTRYKILKGTDASVLVFGFLYDFRSSCAMARVSMVEDVVKAEWFRLALLNETYDGIVVLAHMDLVDSLVYKILDSIRTITDDTALPVQFITGHTHYRGQKTLEPHSTTFEAGRYLDTIGFVSFRKRTNNADEGSDFQHVFLDANVETLGEALELDNEESLLTENGRQVQQMIAEARNDLNLDEVYGCAPQHLLAEQGLDKPDSLWGVFLHQAVREFYFQGSPQSVLAMGSGAFRYDLFQGNVTMDDIIIVSPFNDTLQLLTSQLSGSDLLRVLDLHRAVHESLPRYATTVQDPSEIEPDRLYRFYTVEYDLEHFLETVESVTGHKVTPAPQPIGTTDLWIQFVKTKWQNFEYCQEQKQQGGGRRGPTQQRFSFVLLGMGGGMALLVVVFIIVVVQWTSRRNQRHTLVLSSDDTTNQQQQQQQPSSDTEIVLV